MTPTFLKSTLKALTVFVFLTATVVHGQDYDKKQDEKIIDSFKQLEDLKILTAQLYQPGDDNLIVSDKQFGLLRDASGVLCHQRNELRLRACHEMDLIVRSCGYLYCSLKKATVVLFDLSQFKTLLLHDQLMTKIDAVEQKLVEMETAMVVYSKVNQKRHLAMNFRIRVLLVTFSLLAVLFWFWGDLLEELSFQLINTTFWLVLFLFEGVKINFCTVMRMTFREVFPPFIVLLIVKIIS